jgi:hypothetical protein
MAVNVNTVYQKVLALANKEQRGYITPQEFNYFADQAQLYIFEQYFYDLDRLLRVPGNDTVYADRISIIEEKIDIFERYNQDISLAIPTTGSLAGKLLGTLPSSNYRLGKIFYLENSNDLIFNETNNNNNEIDSKIEIALVPQNKLYNFLNSNILKPTEKTPIYVKNSVSVINIFPSTITGNVTCNYIAKPSQPVFGYVVVNGKALYNESASTNFELHASEENNLVYKILEYAGVAIEDLNLTQSAFRERITSKNEKNN